MLLLDRTLPTLAENLALDEALLLAAEAGGPEVLRFWQWPAPAVVLGAGGRITDDVHEERCVADGVPLARRSSGGGTVLLGPGCLLYAVVLRYDRDPELSQIRSSYCYILNRVKSALHGLVAGLDGCDVRGSSDVAWLDRKVSGNAQQRKRMHLLHHGTLLYDFDHERVAAYLKLPPRQPEYRRQRSHGEFLANLPVDLAALKARLRSVWQAEVELAEWPADTVVRLVEEKYSQLEWVRRR
jgi:lipoate-protein ligase A